MNSFLLDFYFSLQIPQPCYFFLGVFAVDTSFTSSFSRCCTSGVGVLFLVYTACIGCSTQTGEHERKRVLRILDFQACVVERVRSYK